MAVIRQLNLLGQQRVDVPHLRSLESAVAADFHLLAGKALAGKQSLVLKGLNIITTGAYGAAANQLEVQVGGSVIMHYNASEAGTIFSIDDDADNEQLTTTNSRVVGSFTPSQTNYVGLELRRTANASTADLVKFRDPDTSQETSLTVPLARVMDYYFVISTTDFSSNQNVLPIAKVTTDASNNVVTNGIEDCRQMMFRLGSGGDNPDIQNAYSWPGTRFENTLEDVYSGDPYVGDPFDKGDKTITSMKEWMDAMMTRVWEIGGGEYWYSAASDKNVTMIWTGAVFSNGENFEWDGTDLHWKGIRFLFDNSTAYYNDVADQLIDSVGLTDLADGECIYVDLDRTQNTTVTARKEVLATLGSAEIPGSRYVLAWRQGAEIYTRNWRYAVGKTFIPATPTFLGVAFLSGAADDADAPRVVTHDDSSNLAIAAGITRDGHYSIGSGAVSIGTGTNDASVTISKTGATTTVAGALSVAQTLGVTGATSLSTLSTSGLATLNSASITGNATVGGTLGVTGVANFSSNVLVAGALGVTGLTTLNSLSAGATSTTTLSSSGLATLNSLSVTNAATVGGILTMNSSATVAGTLGVTGAVTLSNALTVSGLATFNGRADFTNAVYSTGSFSGGPGATTGAAVFGQSSGTGRGVHGYNSSTGHGIRAESSGGPCIQFYPRTGNPSGKSDGSFWIDESIGAWEKFYFYLGGMYYKIHVTEGASYPV